MTARIRRSSCGTTLAKAARHTYKSLYLRCEVSDADHERVVITRAGHDPVVLVSLEDYEALKETAYLLHSPANARRLLDSIDRLEAGKGVEKDPIE
jgi:antitoxin YefM